MNECFSNYANHGEWKNRSITFADCNKIVNLIRVDLSNKLVSPEILHYLYLLTTCSKKFYSEEIPENVITMNSEVILGFEDNLEKTIRIVFPSDVKMSNDISIYSSLGAACLGAKKGSFIFFNDESGHNRAFIKELVFQPEKEKVFYL